MSEPEDLDARKRRTRAELSARRRAVAPAAAAEAGRAVASRVAAVAAVARARCVALYAALADELPTRPLFEALAGAGARLALPRGGAEVLHFAILPGVAFDAAGHRLGRGGGHYDRTFPPGAPDPPLLIGVGYEFQVLASVPHGPQDRRLDGIITERAVRWAAESEP